MPFNRRSKNITQGVSRSPNRSMYYALGYEKEDFDKPMIGIANGHSTITPCNSGLQKLADVAISAIKQAGANPQVFGTPTISDGMSMGTEGMKYSLISREVIADCIETAVNGGNGFSEGLVTNFMLQSAQYASNGEAADPAQGAVGLEHDFTNNSGTDCAPGINCLGMTMNFGGTNQSLTGVQLDGGGYVGGKGGAIIWGIRLVNHLASDIDIDDMSNADVGLGFGIDGFGTSTHHRSTIQDGSISPVSYLASGRNSDSVWSSTGTAAVGLKLGGSYSKAQIAGQGWAVDPRGGIAGRSVGIGRDGLKLTQLTIADLPACATANYGLIELVSDTAAMAAPTWHGQVVGGGTTSVDSLVFCTKHGWQYD